MFCKSYLQKEDEKCRSHFDFETRNIRAPFNVAVTSRQHLVNISLQTEQICTFLNVGRGYKSHSQQLFLFKILIWSENHIYIHVYNKIAQNENCFFLLLILTTTQNEIAMALSENIDFLSLILNIYLKSLN